MELRPAADRNLSHSAHPARYWLSTVTRTVIYDISEMVFRRVLGPPDVLLTVRDNKQALSRYWRYWQNVSIVRAFHIHHSTSIPSL